MTTREIKDMIKYHISMCSFYCKRNMICEMYSHREKELKLRIQLKGGANV